MTESCSRNAKCSSCCTLRVAAGYAHIYRSQISLDIWIQVYAVAGAQNLSFGREAVVSKARGYMHNVRILSRWCRSYIIYASEDAC